MIGSGVSVFGVGSLAALALALTVANSVLETYLTNAFFIHANYATRNWSHLWRRP